MFKLSKLIFPGIAGVAFVSMIAVLYAMPTFAGNRPRIARATGTSTMTPIGFGHTSQRLKSLASATEYTAFGAELVPNLGKPLLNEGDPKVRADVANLFTVILRGRQSAETDSRECQPQMLEFLSAAYDGEKDQNVKLAIVESLSHFDIPEAIDLLNRAELDPSADIQKAAQKAKIARQRRLLFSCCK